MFIMQRSFNDLVHAIWHGAPQAECCVPSFWVASQPPTVPLRVCQQAVASCHFDPVASCRLDLRVRPGCRRLLAAAGCVWMAAPAW